MRFANRAGTERVSFVTQLTLWVFSHNCTPPYTVDRQPRPPIEMAVQGVDFPIRVEIAPFI